MRNIILCHITYILWLRRRTDDECALKIHSRPQLLYIDDSSTSETKQQ